MSSWVGVCVCELTSSSTKVPSKVYKKKKKASLNCNFIFWVKQFSYNTCIQLEHDTRFVTQRKETIELVKKWHKAGQRWPVGEVINVRYFDERKHWRVTYWSGTNRLKFTVHELVIYKLVYCPRSGTWSITYTFLEPSKTRFLRVRDHPYCQLVSCLQITLQWYVICNSSTPPYRYLFRLLVTGVQC